MDNLYSRRFNITKYDNCIVYLIYLSVFFIKRLCSHNIQKNRIILLRPHLMEIGLVIIKLIVYDKDSTHEYKS
jgi:hypothetical protein